MFPNFSSMWELGSLAIIAEAGVFIIGAWIFERGWRVYKTFRACGPGDRVGRSRDVHSAGFVAAATPAGAVDSGDRNAGARCPRGQQKTTARDPERYR